MRSRRQTSRTRHARSLFGVLVAALHSPPVLAQVPPSSLGLVVRDGTLGVAPAGVVPSGIDPLSQPADYLIGPELGEQVGSNLFHSFERFGIGPAEVATFTGPDPIDGPQTVSNVIGRVTGGSSSEIDGTLRSTIPGADLYLMNPAGVMFGPDASLDVQGSFHATTADYLRIGDRFSARDTQAPPVLTSAPPEAFGFLGDAPAPLTVSGSFLQVPDGKTLAVIGGPVAIDAGYLAAFGGQLVLVGTSSAGEVPRSDSPDLPPGARLAPIELTGGAALDVSGAGAGSISLRAAELASTGSFIFALTEAHGDGRVVDLQAGSVRIRGEGSGVFAQTLEESGGAGADLAIRADRLELRDGAVIDASALGSGPGGDVSVTAERIEIGPGSAIQAAVVGTGSGGDVVLQAGDLLIHREGAATFTGVSTQSQGSGKGGDIHIGAGSLAVRGGAQLTASAFGSGAGGDVSVSADSILLSGDGIARTGIRANADLHSTGNGGQVRVSAGRLELLSGGEISASTFGAGAAGAITVDAEQALFSGDGSGVFTGISVAANPGSQGDAGGVAVRAGRLELRGGAQISTATFGSGDAGALSVEAGGLRLVGNADSPSTGVFSGTSDASSGDGGDLRVVADTLEIRGDAAQINAVTGGSGRGGDLFVTGGRILLSQGEGARLTGIATAANRTSSGNAGNVTLEANTLQVADGAEISATTFGTGRGGDVSVTAHNVLVQGTGAIVAASATLGSDLADDPEAGLSGNVTIRAAESLRLLGLGTISVETAQADAGSIDVQAELLQLRDSSITTSVAGGLGGGGDISIDPTFVILQNGRIVANAIRGSGGNIRIVSEFFLASADSIERCLVGAGRQR